MHRGLGMRYAYSSLTQNRSLVWGALHFWGEMTAKTAPVCGIILKRLSKWGCIFVSRKQNTAQNKTTACDKTIDVTSLNTKPVGGYLFKLLRANSTKGTRYHTRGIWYQLDERAALKSWHQVAQGDLVYPTNIFLVSAMKVGINKHINYHLRKTAPKQKTNCNGIKQCQVFLLISTLKGVDISAKRCWYLNRQFVCLTPLSLPNCKNTFPGIFTLGTIDTHTKRPDKSSIFPL